MAWFCKPSLIILSLFVVDGTAFTQKAPAAPDHPWEATSVPQHPKVPARPTLNLVPDTGKAHTLSQLIDIAERNNPGKRVACEEAKAQGRVRILAPETESFRVRESAVAKIRGESSEGPR